MKRIAEIIIIIFFIIIILSLPISAQVSNQYGDCTKPLIAGKKNINSGISAGMVRITSLVDDPDKLLVEFITYDGWVMQETHLNVGSTPPTTSAPRQFIYKHDLVEDPLYDKYEVSLARHMINATDYIYFAAHAALQMIGPEGDVLEEESAWALGTPIHNTGIRAKKWAMYFVCTGNGNEDGGSEEGY